MNKINLHVYRSNFKYESRILRETKSIAGSGMFDSIFITGIWESGLPEEEDLDDKRHIWRVYLRLERFSKILGHIEWFVRVFIRLSKYEVAVVNCHSLACLPLGIIFNIFKGSKLIYDTHELETEIEISSMSKMFYKLLERSLIKHADAIIVVSDSIALWYKNAYRLKEVNVIKNFPLRINSSPDYSDNLRKKFSIRDNEILYIYQGALGEGRGIQILLDVFSRIDRQKQIVFMGFGSLEGLIKSYEANNLNIHFYPPVAPDKLLSYTSSADIGIHMIENTCLNHYYCLPNKIFEYICSGLPVIVSDFPDMGEIVKKNECGWRVPVDTDAIQNLIMNISKKDIKEKHRNTMKCREKFRWEEEEGKLLKIYRSLNIVKP